MLFTPKILIKGLWKELHSFKTKKRTEDLTNDTIGYTKYLDTEIEKRENLINALLEYFFDSAKDEEYISENKPLSTEEQIEG